MIIHNLPDFINKVDNMLLLFLLERLEQNKLSEIDCQSTSDNNHLLKHHLLSPNTHNITN